MADGDRFDQLDARLDRLEAKVDRLLEEGAEVRGANLGGRIDKLEAKAEVDERRWAKVGGVAVVGGAVLHYVSRKLGL